MPNVFERSLKQIFAPSKDIVSMDITDGSIKQHHLEAGLKGIYFDVIAKRPTSPGTNSHYFGWFATDEDKLYLWNGTAWKSTTLT